MAAPNFVAIQSNSCRDILLKTTNVKLTVPVEKSQGSPKVSVLSGDHACLFKTLVVVRPGQPTLASLEPRR